MNTKHLTSNYCGLENFHLNDIKYLQDGRVELDKGYNAQCLFSPDNETVGIKNCVDTNEQEWIYTNGNLLNKNANKCIDPNNFCKLKECDKNGKFIDPIEPDTKFPTLPKKFGKNVVLVSSNDPWYLNKENTIIMPQKIPYQQMPPEMTSYPKPYGMFIVPQIAKQIKTQPEYGVEFFSNNNLQNKFVFLIICILLIFVVYCLYYINLKNHYM